MEPRGRTLWFYRGDECEKGNHLPRSLGLPCALPHHLVGYAPVIPTCPTEITLDGSPSLADQTLFPPREYGTKGLPFGPPGPRSPKAGQTVSTPIPTGDGPASNQNLRTRASVGPRLVVKPWLG